MLVALSQYFLIRPFLLDKFASTNPRTAPNLSFFQSEAATFFSGKPALAYSLVMT